MTLEVISMDWDSTIADTSHRHGMIDRSIHNDSDFWLRYSMECVNDGPGPAYPVAKWLSDTGQPWIIISGRSEGARELSKEWLRRFELTPMYVFMCDDRHDYMDHGEWKALRMKEVQKDFNLKILMHFDDISDVAVHAERINVPTVLVHPIGAMVDSLG